MNEIPGNTPVLVGIGTVEQRCEDWSEAREPVSLMADAARAALADSGCAGLADSLGRIYVPRGLWHYSDPARLVAEAIGAGDATTVLAEIGVLQQTPIGETCRLIADGELDAGLVVGGEARYRWLRAQIAGSEARETPQATEPDITLRAEAELYLDCEVNTGLGYMPVNYYAILESAFRAANGWSIAEHRDRIAALYSRFSAIAARNPHAWKPIALDPQTIRDSAPKNPMLAFPYTKLHNTSWNVDQAAALLFCSAERARALGVPRQRWLFPVASAECNQMLSVAQRRELHRAPGAGAAAARALAAAGCSVAELDFVDLYSCFPIAVESYAAEIGLDPDRDLTVTGGMPFAGGPLNNYVLQASCRLAELMRERPGSRGMTSSVSGLLTKQGIGLWSTEPGPHGFQFIDVTAEVAADNPPLEVAGNCQGDATVAGYTVIYESGAARRAVAMLDLPDGRRAVGWSDDPAVMADMQRHEYCGRRVHCQGDRFSPAGSP
jgi:acetyl-CoA C-acetyltransferase